MLDAIGQMVGGQDDQQGELFARLLAPVCSIGDRCFRELVRIHKLSSDIAGGVHVGNDDPVIGAGDQGILVGYRDEETGGTDVRVRCS